MVLPPLKVSALIRNDMAAVAKKKKTRNKPPIRRVPPGENRGPRAFAVAASVTREEREELKELARGLGFKNTSQLLRMGLDFLFALKKGEDVVEVGNRVMREFVDRAARVSGVQQVLPLGPIFDKDFVARAEATLQQSLGIAPKREGGHEPPASRPEAGHVT